jgi:hypothetical protein
MRTIPYRYKYGDKKKGSKKLKKVKSALEKEFNINNFQKETPKYSSNPRKIVVDKVTGKRMVTQTADETVRHSNKYNFNK